MPEKNSNDLGNQKLRHYSFNFGLILTIEVKMNPGYPADGSRKFGPISLSIDKVKLFIITFVRRTNNDESSIIEIFC